MSRLIESRRVQLQVNNRTVAAGCVSKYVRKERGAGGGGGGEIGGRAGVVGREPRRGERE